MMYSNNPLKFSLTLFLVAFLLISCNRNSSEKVPMKSFVLSDKMLETTQWKDVVEIPLRREYKFFGKIVADFNKSIDVFPVVGGSVNRVYVELGDFVQKGQLLATIRSTEVASFEQELENAKTDKIVAKNNLKVATEMFEGKLVSEREVLEAKSQLEKAMAQLSRIEETYRIYNMRSGAIFEVRSPISGFIIQKNINQDMLLRNDRSNNIFDIAQIDEVWALANVNESEINQVKLGGEALVSTFSYPDTVFQGTVDKIFNIIDPETKAMKIRVKLANSNYLLKPEMRANIRVRYKDQQQLPTIPSSAVIFDKSRYFVMIYHSRNEIETRQIEPFSQFEDITYVKSGLKSGEKVITANQLLIYDALND